MHPEFHLHLHKLQCIWYEFRPWSSQVSLNTSRLDLHYTIISMAVSPSPMHSMISYWPANLGCHGNLTLHLEFHCMNRQPHLHKLHIKILCCVPPSSHLYCTSVFVLNPHHLSHSVYCSLRVLYVHYVGIAFCSLYCWRRLLDSNQNV